MSDTIREYSGLLYFEALSDQQLGVLRKAAEIAGTIVDVGPTYLELTYTGRDSSRFVIAFLKTVAAVIGDARGELVCEIDEDGTRVFEFYMVRSAQLFRQYGHIVRSEILPVG